MFLGSKVRRVRRADNLTTICEPIVYTMWDPEENNAAMRQTHVAQNVMFCPCIATVRHVHEQDNLLLTVRSYKPSHYL
jgi:hypothetical protein